MVDALVIDPDPTDRAHAVRLLKEADAMADIIEATDLEEGLELAAGHQPLLILFEPAILDWADEPPFETFRKVAPAAKIVYTTTLDAKDPRVRASLKRTRRDDGIDGYILKPIPEAGLLRYVDVAGGPG